MTESAHTDEQREFTDPAERLIAVLKAALGTNPNQPFLQMWRVAFGEPQADVIKIYEWLALIRDLVDDVERGIKNVPDI